MLMVSSLYSTFGNFARESIIDIGKVIYKYVSLTKMELFLNAF